jgi:isopropylmalate/homocitrate/citramalate synthase
MWQIAVIIREKLKDKGIVLPDFSFGQIKVISDYIANNMLYRQPHFPITGENAFKHSSG